MVSNSQDYAVRCHSFRLHGWESLKSTGLSQVLIYFYLFVLRQNLSPTTPTALVSSRYLTDTSKRMKGNLGGTGRRGYPTFPSQALPHSHIQAIVGTVPGDSTSAAANPHAKSLIVAPRDFTAPKSTWKFDQRRSVPKNSSIGF